MFRPTKVIDPKTPINKMSEQESNQNIQVFVRCRPLKTTEKRGLLDVVTEKRAVRTVQQNKLYMFDNVFDAKAKQLDVYRSVVEPLVEQVIEGYNCTVFAYGQTGTGKTYTMIGDRTDGNISWEEDPLSGIIPRAVDQLLEDLSNQQTEYSIRVSFLELYNEDAYDLLSPLSDTNKLRIYNDSERKGSVIISGLVEMLVKTKEEIFEILEKGSLKRQTAPTLMNACSSRSHSIFSITVHIKEITFAGEEVVKVGKLNLVDLAGSENIGRSGAVEERAREASNINKSLLTLGRVITSLVEKSSHIPYRDSKLTRLLQDSLGGKTKTSIIATISPCSDDLEDTISTLEYAQRAKKITNKPEINLKMSKKTLINEYMSEIERLRRDLEAARDQKGIYVDAKNYQEMQALLKLQEQNLETDQAKIDDMKKELEKYTILLSEVNENLNTKCKELEHTREKLEELSQDLNETRDSLKKAHIEIEDCKVVIDAHQTTEQKLLNKAKSVIDVTDRCVDDNQRLFHKVESYASAEESNKRYLSQFKNEYSNRMENISQMSCCIWQAITNGEEKVQRLIENDQIDFSNRRNQFIDSVNDIENKIAQFEKAFQDCLSQNQDRMVQAKSDFKPLFESFKIGIFGQLSAMKDFLQKCEIDKNRIQDDLCAEMANTRLSVEESLLSQSTQINQTTKNVIQTIQIIESDHQQIYQQKCQENEMLTKEIEKIRNLIKENELAEKRKKELRQIIEEIESGNHERIAFLSKHLSQVESHSEAVVKLDSDSHNRLAFKCKELSYMVKKNEKDMNVGLSNLDEKFSLNCKNSYQKLDLIKKVDQELTEKFQVFNDQCLNGVDNIVAAVTENIDSLSQHFSDTSAKKIKLIRDFKVETTEGLGQNHAIVDGIMAKIDQSFKQTLDEYKSVESDCETWQISMDLNLNECKNMARKLEVNIKEYKTTGNTPKRTTYLYPKSFTPTSPPERIISRFRTHQAEPPLDFENLEEETEIAIVDENGFSDPDVADKNLNQTYVKFNPSGQFNGEQEPKKLLKEKNSLS